MYTLYGFKGSGSAAVELALELAGLPYRQVDAASWEPGPELAELQRLNPLGQIPTLQLPEGGILTESAAILLHLGLAHPAAGLLPADPAQRAQAIRGLVYIAANCYAAIGVIDFPERWCVNADDAVKQQIREGTRARLHSYWEIFADTYPASPFLNGASLGALDLMAAVVSKWSGARPHLAQVRPAFFELIERVEKHPKVAPVWRRHWDS
ncbi:glutathione S-transferase, N-terminal domain protein [Collimonas fungivorans]|jgi:GST-like protein|uniref:Glutathione S-transferase, N-terminal domain protein n=1 Tax=Collimonas fungivorans TaxID=158899 RepID=A0A127PDT3_9BURK|nr:glutathione S-transferase family protein [Collimonas fungivorans]AMO95970.1 glutathione S-transferase, N-terminal domain protein [Collimonas fungivorans]